MSRVFCDIVKRNNLRSIANISHRRYLRNSTDSKEYDVVIVGGGIVGAATAREMKGRHPQLKMAIVEKEDDLAQHQSGRNSGVVHAGIYYKPGSLKAKLCVEGLNLAYKYCDSKGIPYKKVGKLIVATNHMEVQRLHDLHSRAMENNVPDIKLIKGLKAIQEIEPYCIGVEALWSPHTGIVDWQRVAKRFAQDFQESGGDIFLKYEVTDFKAAESVDHPVLVVSKFNRKLKTKYVLTCGGLHSDHLAKLSGCPQTPKVVPFRGEYLLLNPKKAHLVRGNIYPVPDPRFPFLGVHFTPRMDGSVWLGPNAVLAFQREGYKWSDIDLSELIDAVSYQGLIRMGLRYTMAGAYEIAKSLYTPLQVKELHKFIPQITLEDVQPGPAGVRAQAVDPSGELVDDFYFDMNKSKTGGSIGDRVLHCRNAPSPGATSSLAIAKMMADKLEEVFDLKNAL